MDPLSPRQKGVLLLFVLLPLALGWRYGVSWGEKPPSSKGFGKKPIIIEVKGSVARPGLFAYHRPPSIAQVLRDAESDSLGAILTTEDGGHLFQADGSILFFFQPDGLLHFRTEPLSVKALWILGRPLPLNRATAEELDLLPGVGPVLAQRIVAYREAIGGFASLEQLKEVKGIKEKTYESIKTHLTI